MNYPDNIEEIKKFAKVNNIDVKYLLGENWEGNLNLSFVESLPANIEFDVGGYLNLTCVESLPENIKFNVGGSLSFPYVRSLPDNTIFNVIGKIYFPIDHKVKVIWV